MKSDDLRKMIADCCSDITFSFRNKKCGIFPTVLDSIPTYDVWFGDYHIQYQDVDNLMNDPIFEGRPLIDICDKVDIQAW